MGLKRVGGLGAGSVMLWVGVVNNVLPSICMHASLEGVKGIWLE